MKDKTFPLAVIALLLVITTLLAVQVFRPQTGRFQRLVDPTFTFDSATGTIGRVRVSPQLLEQGRRESEKRRKDTENEIQEERERTRIAEARKEDYKRTYCPGILAGTFPRPAAPKLRQDGVIESSNLLREFLEDRDMPTLIDCQEWQKKTNAAKN